MEATAVNQGWNAMMDESYLNITMKHLAPNSKTIRIV